MRGVGVLEGVEVEIDFSLFKVVGMKFVFRQNILVTEICGQERASVDMNVINHL